MPVFAKCSVCGEMFKQPPRQKVRALERVLVRRILQSANQEKSERVMFAEMLIFH